MAQEISGVFPGSEDATHEIVLSSRGRKFGLKLLNGVSSVHIIPPQRQPPPTKLEQNTWQGGKGAEVWLPNAGNFYNSLNAWTSTPNKLHPAPLFRWAEGFRDVEHNMPTASDTHKWVPLYAGSGSDPNRRYLSVSFTASASSNRERCFLIIRRKGAPTGNVTVEWCADSSGSPGTAQKTVTKAIADFPDIISYYMEFKPSSVLAVTSATVYHIKVYGATNDTSNNCWEVLCDNAAAGKNSSDNSSWSATTYSPYFRITDEDIEQRIYFFPFSGTWYAVTSRGDRANSKLYIIGNRGRATAGTSTTLTDSGAGQYGGTWTTNMWANYKIGIIRGTGQGQTPRTILSNTGTVITVSAWTITPDATSEYIIYGGPQVKEITGHGLGWVSSKPVYTNGIVYFPQSDTVDIRIMQLNYANANDHGFDAENTNLNRAWFLAAAYDSSLGPVMVRANQAATAGTPAGKAISIARAPTAPSGTPVPFGTDLTFQTSVLIGENTYRITGLYVHSNQIYVAKEDLLFNVSGNIPVGTDYGASGCPSIRNGLAACTGADGQFYIAAEHDVFLISGGNAYPLNLPFNLPSTQAGYVFDLVSQKGWLFAAVHAGTGSSSIMRMTLQDRSWHEQVRSFASSRYIRSLAWLSLEESRSQLWYECAGELLYQEMPLFGVRPSQDTGMAYQHEGVVELPTIDLLNTNPKYFSFFALDSKNLADSDTSAVYGREIALDYQLNNNIGAASANWIHGGSFGISPQDKVMIGKGSQMKIRPRLRIENNDPDNPPIVENLSLSLFSRTETFNSFLLDVNAAGEDEMSGEELYEGLVDMLTKAEVVNVESVFDFLHNKQMLISVQPNANITSLDEEGWNGVLQVYVEYMPT